MVKDNNIECCIEELGEEKKPLTCGSSVDVQRDKIEDLKEKSHLSFVEWEPMEDICCKLFRHLKIIAVSSLKSLDNRQVLFSFCVPQVGLA